MGEYKDRKICGKQYTEILIGIEKFFKNETNMDLLIILMKVVSKVILI